MAEQALHLLVKGSVQGVGFRWFVVQNARRLDLSGWVKNRSDGSVELFAAGAPEALATLETEVSRGPDGARVESVERLGDAVTTKLSKPFSIMRDR